MASYLIKEDRPDGDVDFYYGCGLEDPNRFFMCTCTKGYNSTLEEILRDGLKDRASFGIVRWVPVDIIDKLAEDDVVVSTEWAKAFLEEHEDEIEERMTPKGWDVIYENLPADQEEADQMAASDDYSR